MSYDRDASLEDANGRVVQVGDDVLDVCGDAEGRIVSIVESVALKGKVYVQWSDRDGESDEWPSNVEVV
jgi:hypothetical protein